MFKTVVANYNTGSNDKTWHVFFFLSNPTIVHERTFFVSSFASGCSVTEMHGLRKNDFFKKF